MRAPAFAYSCFGQHIHSDFCFQEMDEEAAGAQPDVVITRSAELLRPTAIQQIAEFQPDRQFFDFPGVIQAEISNASTLAIALYPDAAEEMLGLPVLGPIMATLLHYKGYLVIHGSGLVIDGRLNVFVGHRGAGKSTTAACLLDQGHQLFSDDLIAVDLSDPSNPVALTGYPAIKLAPDIASHFQPQHARPISNGGYTYPKSRLRIQQERPPERMPIDAIYVLERAEHPEQNELDFKAAMSTLMHHSYMLKFGKAPMTKKRAARHFLQATQLATLVSVRQLRTPSTLDALHKIEPLLLGAA